jgi:hypothetical protein
MTFRLPLRPIRSEARASSMTSPQATWTSTAPATHSCYKPSGTQGVLSTSTSAYAKAYGTTTGYDFATGLGTVIAYNLVRQWSTVAP